jgi:hypothetical protein
LVLATLVVLAAALAAVAVEWAALELLAQVLTAVTAVQELQIQLQEHLSLTPLAVAVVVGKALAQVAQVVQVLVVTVVLELLQEILMVVVMAQQTEALVVVAQVVLVLLVLLLVMAVMVVQVL